MRHNKRGRKLNRTWEHRKALLRNMAKSLVTHGRIKTTEAKAKELRPVADKLITLALRDDLHSRRQAYKVLGSHTLVKKLFDEIGPRFTGGGGGYTRVVRMSMPRPGDAAPMAMIEFTRYEGDLSAAAVKGESGQAAPVQAAPAVAAATEVAAAESAQDEETAVADAAEEAPTADAAPETAEEPAPESGAEATPEGGDTPKA